MGDQQEDQGRRFRPCQRAPSPMAAMSRHAKWQIERDHRSLGSEFVYGFSLTEPGLTPRVSREQRRFAVASRATEGSELDPLVRHASYSLPHEKEMEQALCSR